MGSIPITRSIPPFLLNPTTRVVLGAPVLATLWACTPDPPEPPSDQVGKPEPSVAVVLETAPVPRVRELQWDDLIPAEWQPQKILDDFDAENLSDDDPRAQALLDKLQELWKLAPVVSGLDGQTVSLPGFVVPTEGSDDRVAEFLLVPYMGACIHVPPPPANQTVYVVTAPGREYRGALFDPVTVTGQLRVQATDNDLGSAGYFIAADSVVRYE